MKKVGQKLEALLQRIDTGDIDQEVMKSTCLEALACLKKDASDIHALMELGAIMRQALWPYKDIAIKEESGIGTRHAPQIIEAWDRVINELGE